MRTIIHDGKGKWFRTQDVFVSSLTDDDYATLRRGDDRVLNDLPGSEVQPLVGYTTDGRTSIEDLMRVITCWLPYSTLDKHNGRLYVDTGLKEASDGSGRLQRADD